MALTQAQANMVLGGRGNQRRMIFGIPAGPSGEDPGMLCLESSSGTAGTHSLVYIWADSANVLRYSSTIPTDENSDGTIIAGTAASTAARDLSNLLTTSINTSLISDTDSTDSLGSSSSYWAATYTDVLYLYSTAYITGTSGTMTTTGNVVLGANGTASDVTFYGDTADVYMWWDGNANTNGALIFTGATATPSLQFTNTNVTYTAILATDVFTFDATDHASAGIVIGNDTTTNGIDLTYYTATAGSNITINAGTNTLKFSDVTVTFEYGTDPAGAFTTGSNILYYDGNAANDTFNIGHTNATDVQIDGNAYDLLWDASANSLIFKDNAILAIGTDSDLTIKFDATDFLIDGANANVALKIGATNNLDLYIYAQTATSYVYFNTDDTAGNCTFTNYDLCFANGTTTYTFAHSTHDLLLSATDAATSRLLIGATGGTTHGLDVIWNAHTNGAEVTFDGGGDTCTFDGVDLILNDADILKFGDAGADASFASDGTNLDVTITALMTLGDGGTTNYTGISAAGAITCAGTAYITCVQANANGLGLRIPVKSTSGNPGTTGTTTGSLMYNQNDGNLMIFNGTAWKTCAIST